MANKKAVLSLYHAMLRESSKIENYNFRCYAKRRVSDAFHSNKLETDQKRIEMLMQTAKDNLELIRRQSMIGSMYCDKATVIEKYNKH